jgi:hypothetical protein
MESRDLTDEEVEQWKMYKQTLDDFYLEEEKY